MRDQGETAWNMVVDHKLEIRKTERESWWKFVITTDECRRVALQMKNNKATDADGIQTEHLKNGSHDFIVILLGYVQESSNMVVSPVGTLRCTVIVPILKDNSGDRNDPDNYRRITISSVLGKLI